MREPLADDLVGQAPLAVLILGRRRQVHLLDIVLAVVQLAVHARPAAVKAGAIGGRRRLVSQVARHLFAGAQRAEVKGAHHGVRADELDVVGVVLHPLHHPVAIGIPLHPSVFQRLLDLGPEFPQPGVVAA